VRALQPLRRRGNHAPISAPRLPDRTSQSLLAPSGQPVCRPVPRPLIGATNALLLSARRPRRLDVVDLRWPFWTLMLPTGSVVVVRPTMRVRSSPWMASSMSDTWMVTVRGRGCGRGATLWLARQMMPLLEARRCTMIGPVRGTGGGPAGRSPDSQLTPAGPSVLRGVRINSGLSGSTKSRMFLDTDTDPPTGQDLRRAQLGSSASSLVRPRPTLEDLEDRVNSLGLRLRG